MAANRDHYFAEEKGFEPPIPLWGIHTFQACALSHSATPLKLDSPIWRLQINQKFIRTPLKKQKAYSWIAFCIFVAELLTR